MKKSKQCPKCESLRIGYLESLPDREDGACTKPQVIGQVEEGEPTFFSNGTWRRHWYEVEGYLCADCGYVETYVKAPEAVAYDKLEGFCWVKPETTEEGPYR